MGGDFRGGDYTRANGTVYYFFAREFGWTKQQVDVQQVGYLNSLIFEYQEEARKERLNLNRHK